jgi:hypothetical protein
MARPRGHPKGEAGREDFKAEGLNTIGAARPRGTDDEVGETYEPEKSREARTSHPRGWIRFGDYR